MFNINIIRDGSAGSISASQLAQVESCLASASSIWGRYINGAGRTLNINLSFQELGGNTLARGGTGWASSNGGPTTFNSLSILATGNDPNGASGEMNLTIDLGTLQMNGFFISSDTDYELDVPSGQSDLLTVLLHEMGHGFGIGLISSTSFKSPYEAFLSGATFIGTHAVAANGGAAVALTAGNSHLANPSDVMFPSLTNGTRYTLSPVNVGIIRDVGAPIVVPTNGSDTLYGYELVNDMLRGLNGNDFMYGLGGADILDGGANADTMYGGRGNDIYIIDQSGDRAIEVAGQGADRVQSSTVSVNLASFPNVENALLTGTANLNLTGTTGANFLYGNSGANTINGVGGADTMSGGAGHDTYITNGGDTLIESAGGGTDTVRSSVNFALAANFENLVLIGTAAITGRGTSETNSLSGQENSAANVLTGLGGSDFYVVGAGDTIVETSDGGTDRVQSSTISINVGNYANVENGQLLGATALSITGNSSNNLLWGNAGNNVIAGSHGNDALTGGGGRDYFLFNTGLNSATNIDRILDFALDDTIRLDNAIFTRIAQEGILLAGYFRIGSAAADPNDYIIYNSSTGALFYDNNGNISGGATQFATIGRGLALTANDFFVV